MSRSFALLTLAAFALSAPINARTLLASGETDESAATTGVPADVVTRECTKETSQLAANAEATGGMPDTEAAAAGARAQGTCCWIYWMGRWWCIEC